MSSDRDENSLVVAVFLGSFMAGLAIGLAIGVFLWL